MAVTGFWPVKSRLKDVLSYAENPEKTTDKNLSDVLRYAANEDKTEQTLYVSAINCPKQRAYQCMIDTKKRFDKPGEMEYHKHYKEEIYFFFKGEGFVRIDGEEFPVVPGDVVRIPPNAMHTVINRRNAELLWAALWWDVIE